MRLRVAALALAALALAALAVASCGDDDATPPVDGVVEEGGQSNGHTDGRVDYGAAPPSGGDHAPIWLNCGVHDAPVPDELAVHSLEHGAVWFAHDPDLPAEAVAELQRLHDLEPDRVLVSPYPGVEAPVVAVAWERRLVADGVDDPRLEAFLDAFAGGAQAPEPSAPCTGGLDPE